MIETGWEGAPAPEVDGVPEWELRVVSYLNDEGEPCFRYTTTPDASYSSIVGVLDMAAHEFIHDANPKGMDA